MDDNNSSSSSSSPPTSSVIHNALGSATAGIISRLFTHPLDTAKARIQATNATTPTTTTTTTTFRGTIDVLTRTTQTEGFSALYRGLGAVLVGGTPGTVLYLCSYDWLKHHWHARDRSDSTGTRTRIPEWAVHLVCGTTAEAIACIVYVPVDVIKERLQVQQRTVWKDSYRGSFDALRRILQTEGLRGIYKGYGATLASFGPFSALYFACFEECKRLAVQRVHHSGEAGVEEDGGGRPHELPFGYLVGCSALSGAVASWCTSPLDLAKLRLQIERGAGGGVGMGTGRRTMWGYLVQTHREAGWRGLFRGAGARVLHFVPATTITMTCYEKCRLFYASSLDGRY